MLSLAHIPTEAGLNALSSTKNMGMQTVQSCRHLLMVKVTVHSHESLAHGSSRFDVDYSGSTVSHGVLQDWKHARAANKAMLEATHQGQIADFVSWRQQQLRVRGDQKQV